MLAKYKYTAIHVPGKFLYAADALSRAPDSDPELINEDDLQTEAEAFVQHLTMPSLPATNEKLSVYKQAQEKDPERATVRKYCQSSWPGRDSVSS